MAGTFGYELDLNKMTEEEKVEVKRQIEVFKQYYDLISDGSYFRLTSRRTTTASYGKCSKGRIQSADQCGLPECADQLRGEVCLSERTVQRCFL